MGHDIYLNIKSYFMITVLVLSLLVPSFLPAENKPDTFVTESGFHMIPVKAGTFEMGSNSAYVNQKPVHTVTLSRDYYISKYEVTYDQYDSYCRETKIKRASPDIKKRGQRPVEGVHFIEALAYCNWLSEKEGLTPCYVIQGHVSECDFKANGYRLPTEAEWEYAARGGHKMTDTLFSGSNDPLDVAWFIENSESNYMKIGLKKPNELGIHDMSGNMWEWCWDWYDKDYYGKSLQLDPVGPLVMPRQEMNYDPERSRRSGRWLNPREYITVSSRSADFVHYRGDNGMRLVRTIPNQQK